MEQLTTINLYCETCATDVVVFGYILSDEDHIIEDFENYDDRIHEPHDLSFVGQS